MKDPVVRAEKLTLRLDGTELLRDFDLEVRKGEKVLLSGDSGSGKSSLLSAFLGFQELQEGALEVFGHSVDGEEVWEVRAHTAYLPQEYELKLESVRELFFLPFGFKRNRDKRPSGTDARGALRTFALDPALLDRDPDAISGGEKQRVLAASLLQLDKPLYLLDEPTSSLDPTVTATFIDAFVEDPERTVIAVAHDPEWKAKVDRVIHLPSGQELQHG
jgi:ABC-type lipoprotein export system ATPase subunit